MPPFEFLREHFFGTIATTTLTAEEVTCTIEHLVDMIRATGLAEITLRPDDRGTIVARIDTIDQAERARTIVARADAAQVFLHMLD